MLFKKFKMLLHDLIVKVYYNESLFYIITISICKILKHMIIRENIWTFELMHYVVEKENIVYVKDLVSF
jgi:hypothetical protein